VSQILLDSNLFYTFTTWRHHAVNLEYAAIFTTLWNDTGLY